MGPGGLQASITALKHELSIDDLDHLAARTLAANQIGFAHLATAAPIAFDPYDANRETGSFILVDRITNLTVAGGMIAYPLRRASNIHQESLSIDKVTRSQLKHQKPTVLWFTGLPASGKSTIANRVELKLATAGYHTIMLDGDNLRHGLNRDLGFTDADRVENVRRAGEVARLFIEAGLIVLCAFISPFRAERRAVRELFDPDEFIEVFVDTPLEKCASRDPKGLYTKARLGLIPNFTGVDSAYEVPEAPEIRLNTLMLEAEESAEQIVLFLQNRDRLSRV